MSSKQSKSETSNPEEKNKINYKKKKKKIVSLNTELRMWTLQKWQNDSKFRKRNLLDGTKHSCNMFVNWYMRISAEILWRFAKKETTIFNHNSFLKY